MSELRDKTEAELRLRGYSFKTRKAYLGHIERFVRFYMKDPREQT